MDSLHEVNKGVRALQIVIYIMVIVDKDLSHITRVLQLVIGNSWRKYQNKRAADSSTLG